MDIAKFPPQPQPRYLDGSELLPGLVGRTVLNYWRWAHSDILENVQRGIFAEYIVLSRLTSRKRTSRLGRLRSRLHGV